MSVQQINMSTRAIKTYSLLSSLFTQQQINMTCNTNSSFLTFSSRYPITRKPFPPSICSCIATELFNSSTRNASRVALQQTHCLHTYISNTAWKSLVDCFMFSIGVCELKRQENPVHLCSISTYTHIPFLHHLSFIGRCFFCFFVIIVFLGIFDKWYWMLLNMMWRCCLICNCIEACVMEWFQDDLGARRMWILQLSKSSSSLQGKPHNT